MILDFKEIPQANIGNGEQDTFEMFARDFFIEFGFEIVEGPDRGADGGRDLIVKEKREGKLGISYVTWLVSCKHKAHSGESVKPNDEENLKNRLDAFGAKGFIGFYSTIPSSGLQTQIKNILRENEYKIYDKESIEKFLIEQQKECLLARYFPKSFKKIKIEDWKPSNIFDEYVPLKCSYCGKDLLSKEMESLNIICFVERIDNNFVEDIYWSCKGSCDRKMISKLETDLYTTTWEDISDIAFSTGFIRWIIAILNNIRDEEIKFSDNAFEKLKEFILIVSQVITRDTHEEKKERLKRLMETPFF